MTELRVISDDRRPFFTPKTLAQYFAVSERTVRQLLADGEIASTKIAGQRRIASRDADEYCAHTGIKPIERPVPEPKPTQAKRSPGTTWPYEDWAPDEQAYAAILLADPCCYCGSPTQAIDHIVASARGGEHSWENFTAACKRCNSGKCARSLCRYLLGRAR